MKPIKAFTLYIAAGRGNAKNCLYPTETVIRTPDDMRRAMQRDHVCAKYKGSNRSAAGFEWSDCIPMDCDNDHSEDPAAWKQPEDVIAAFPNVTCAVCYSRNHMKEKNGKAARPKFHVYFPIQRVSDKDVYVTMKRQVHQRFPYFDENALDAARFYFGTEEPECYFYAGDKTVDEVLPTPIAAGSRNATLSQKAGRLIKRYGDTPKSLQMFQVEAARCVPPLTEQELESIWNSARKFGERLAERDDYIPPEQFNSPAEKLAAMRPESNRRYAWSDIGAGRLFADFYKDIARYVPERKSWYCYANGIWSADVGSLKAMEYCKDLADAMVVYALSIEDEQKRQDFIKYTSKRQTRRIRETILRDAQGVYPIAMSEFDGDPYVFNCKNGTLHLDTMEFTEHRPEDRLTKISDVVYDPAARCDRFLTFVDEISSGDADKAKFLQKALGYGISGDTRYECMFIFYGATTRNGKGTLCESVLKVIGSYGCTARSETIGVKPVTNSQMPSEDVARLAGVRFVNISEPDRGLRLDAALVKSMTGNDTLNARFLHENSFDFKPQFKMYINTNYRTAISDMTLFSSNRIVVITFDRHFEESEQDKNLKSLFAQPNSQSAILNWLLEGYRMLREEGLRIPQSVREAIEDYQKDSDKIARFTDDCLEQAKNAEVRTGEVYRAYTQWCEDNGCRAESAVKFNQALSKFASIERKRPRGGGNPTTIMIGYKIIGTAQAI